MEIEEIAKRDNPVLHRTELEFILHHPGEKTPERDSVRALVADHLGGAVDGTIVDHLDSEFGRASTKGYAKVYESVDHAREIEADHLLERNGIATEA